MALKVLITIGKSLTVGFYAVDAQVGELEWQYQPMRSQAYVSGGVYGQPALYKNQLLVPDLDGSLRVFVVREVQ
ncbi:hypothetical protein [Vibrio metoecus]|uniref:hypothetical protein n=1 Tax=Vibrio metoecus TaxID=1481663 RepID=UPI0027DCE9FB|nr:hypothetical protein [Vibrio metoecus]